MSAMLNFPVIHLITCLFIYWPQAETPFKPDDEFTVGLEYTFRQKPVQENTKVSFESRDNDVKKNEVGNLPYLVLAFRITKFAEHEYRLKIISGNGQTMLSKKAELNVVYKIDLGYTDDLKDGVSANEFNIYLLSKDKKEVSLVKLFVQKDGTFLVNNKVRGRF